ncbi:hypothetical protein [Pseudomonas aegrilactucae]|uniref:Metallo-beta-lactamase domain-containing protein n=1 Tax=Pseudomonas aegrilactucae TaxID=2854028 RepID=A0A9Q3AD36_9PSED|nr:hypothetical protein [Pseudomonas aegrilactucae]MBV6285965.1 hypothetical protein [Pseudomonas aegrilactucae]
MHVSADHSVLIDCGLFQGEDARRSPGLNIDFPIGGIQALLLTHIHLNHWPRQLRLVHGELGVKQAWRTALMERAAGGGCCAWGTAAV